MATLPPKKAKALKLAKQAQGMLAKVVELIEQGAYCPDIIQQSESVCGFMNSVKRELLAGHLDTCVMKRMSENKGQTIKELLKIYNLSER